MKHYKVLAHEIIGQQRMNGYSVLIKARFFFNRHADREAEPKNYDITKSDIDERDLLRATYNRIGNITDGVSFIIIKSLIVHSMISG